MMKIVGLTGIMGSGKSSVARVFAMLGVPTYDCDSRAKELMVEELRDEIEAIVGGGVYGEGGELDRGRLASMIFGDEGLKCRVEEVVHRSIRQDIRQWVGVQRAKGYVVVESALLFGSVIEQDMDYVVAVCASREEIVRRVVRRDGVTPEQVEQRLQWQMEQQEIEMRSDYVLHTSEDEVLTPKVVALHEKLLSLCSDKSVKL